MPTDDPRDYNAPGDPRFERILHGFTKKNDRRENSTRPVRLSFPHRIYPLIVAAARARDISVSAFVARSALAMAVYDQGLDWDEEASTLKPISRFNNNFDRPEEYRAGRGGGPWHIRSVE